MVWCGDFRGTLYGLLWRAMELVNGHGAAGAYHGACHIVPWGLSWYGVRLAGPVVP